MKRAAKSVFWKWMRSYVAVMFVLIICNSITYWHSTKMLIENRRLESDRAARQISANLSGNIDAMEDLIYTLLLQEEVRLLGRESEGSEPDEAYAKYILCGQLGQYKRINGNYEELFLYFCNDDYIVASDAANTSQNYWRTYGEKYGGMDWNQWMELMNGNYPFLQMKICGDKVLFVKTIQENKWDRAQINIIFMYQQNDLENLLFPAEGTDEGFALQHGSAGEEGRESFLTSELKDCGEEDKRLLDAAMAQGDSFVKLSGAAKRVYLNNYELDLGYRLTVYWSDSAYFGGIRDYQYKITLLLLGSVGASILLMFYFLKRNYGQVTTLLDMLKINAKDIEETNEFRVIGGRLSQMQENLRAADDRLERQSDMFRKAYLENLLKGIVPKDAAYVEELYKIHWLGEQFTVLLFYAEEIEMDESQEWKEIHDKKLDLEFIRFVFGNVCEELFGDRGCAACSLMVDSVIALLVNFPEADMRKNKDMMLEVTEQLQEFMDQHLNIRYTLSAGDICKGREGIGDAYQQAVYVMETKRVYELDECLFYSDVKLEPHFGYYYPMEIERELIVQIQDQNTKKAEEMIEKLFAENKRINIGSIQEISKYLCYDIWCTILKALEGNFSVLEKSGLFKTDWKNKKELLLGFDRICEILKEDRDKDFQNEEEMCQRIEQYIVQHLTDCTLGVTSIAEHFHLSSVEMSKTFRRIRGQKLPSYISALRILRAKEIMQTSDKGLNDVAQMAGFGSVRTFLRCFKQSEGMTPSQWKESGQMP